MNLSLRRTSLALSMAVAASLLPLGGCAQSRADQKQQVSPAIAGMVARSAAEVPFERNWELQLPGRIERSWIGQQLPNLIFFQIEGTHEIHAVDALSGVTRWVTIPLPRAITGSAFVQHLTLPGEREREVRVVDSLFLVVDDSLYCFDVGTGQVSWRFVLPFAPSTGPLAVGHGGALRVFLGDWNDRLQVVTLHSEKGFPYVIWQWPLGATLLSPGVETEELSYFSDSKGAIRCFKLDRTEVWNTPTGGAIEGGVAIRDRTLYAGNEGNSVHAINRLTGERLGQYNLSAPVRRRPFTFNIEPERLYVWTTSDDQRRGGLHALRVQPDSVQISENSKQTVEVVRTGEDWFVPGATELVASTPLHLIVSDDNSQVLWAIHRGTGRVEWIWDLAKGWTGKAPLDHVIKYLDQQDSLRSVFIADQSGKVSAFRLFGFVPTPEQEAKGVTSRALADQGKPPAAKPAEAAPKPAKAKAAKPAAEKPAGKKE